MPWFYYVTKVSIRMLAKILVRLKVTGRENVPPDGPLLIVSNHLHAWDPPVLGISLPRIMIFMAKEELFRFRLYARLIRGWGSFPVSRARLDRKAIRSSQKVLASGMALVMFPEGSRSETAQLQPALSGSALVASLSRVPLLPVGMTGTEKIRGWTWVFRRLRLTVNIGKPFYLPAPQSRFTRAELAKHTDFMMRHIAELLPPEYRGVYGGEKGRGED